MVFIRCGFFKFLKYLNLKSEFADASTIQETIAADFGIPTDYISVFFNGKHADSDQRIPNDSSIDICFRLPGGKGGFGSMLRAIGAQIEKTTNREACRDLSGRRLRDINEEQRLKRWLAKKAEREAEQLRRRKERLERLKQLPKHEFHDPEYNKLRSELPERIDEALSEGLKKASSSGKRKPSSAKGSSEPAIKKERLWLDEEVMSDSDASDQNDQDASLSPDFQTGENSQAGLDGNSGSKKEESSKSPACADTTMDNNPLETAVAEIPSSSESKEKSKSESVTHSATVTSNDASETIVEVPHSSETENVESTSCDKPEILQGVTEETPTDVKQCNQTTEDVINEPSKTDTEGASTVSENKKQTEDGCVVDLLSYKSPAALESLGMERLKTVLMHMGLKCGGTLAERAQRLWLVLGLDPKDYPNYLRAKPKKK